MLEWRRTLRGVVLSAAATLVLAGAPPAQAATYGPPYDPPDEYAYSFGGTCDTTFLDIPSGTCSVEGTADEPTGDVVASASVATPDDGSQVGWVNGDALAGFAVEAPLPAEVMSAPIEVTVHVDSASASVGGQTLGIPLLTEATGRAYVSVIAFGYECGRCIEKVRVPVVDAATGPVSVSGEDVVVSFTLEDPDGWGFENVYVIAEVGAVARVRYDTGTAAASIRGTIASIEVG